MSFICTKRTRPKTRLAGWGGALAVLGLLVLGLRAQAQVTVDTIGGGPRINSCATWAGFEGGDTYTNAQFNDPYAASLDSQGNLWVADTTNSDVEQITQAGNLTASITSELAIVAAVDSKPDASVQYYLTNRLVLDIVPSDTNLPAKATLVTNFHPFPRVNGVTVDPAGNLYVMMPTNGLLLKYNQFLDPLSAIQFTNAAALPMALALMVDNNSNVFITFTNGSIARFQLVDDYPPPVYTAALNPNNLVSVLTNSAATNDQVTVNYIVPSFNWTPVALTLRVDGLLAVSDTLSNAIYLVANQTNSLPKKLTGGNGVGSAVGTTNFAQFDQPHGIAASEDGRMVVCDTMNNRVCVIDTFNVTTNLYGTPSNVWTATYCDEVPALFAGWVDGLSGTTVTSAAGREPVSVTISPDGSLFVTEQYYDLIRGVSGSGLSPVNAVAVSLNLAPVVTTLFASNITTTSATLNAAVDPEGEAAVAYFQWGTTSSNGNVTISTNLTANLNITNIISLPLTNLQPATTYFYQGVAVNSTGSGSGVDLVFTTLPNSPPTLSFAPNSGYFPECVTISVTSSVETLYYTTDGTAPTTNSTELTLVTNDAGAFTNSLQWCDSQHNLSDLQFLAINTNNGVTLVVAGSAPTNNLVGFPQPLFAGSGATAYIPVVVDLESGAALQSLQFLLQISTNTGSTPPITNLSLQGLTPDDMVPLPGPAPDNAPVNFQLINEGVTTNGLEAIITAEGSSSGLNMQSSGVAVLLAVPIPLSAPVGSSYTFSVIFPTGTSDGEQAAVPLNGLANTLTINDPFYFVGDSSPANGYNAGEFGNGLLDNSDVNNAIYASVGIRLPYVFSDIYGAMDAYPPPAGDDLITYLDWITILNRSLGVDTNNYIRYHTTNGVVTVATNWSPGGPPIGILSDAQARNPGVSKLSATNTPPGLVWFRQARVAAGTQANVAPGSVCAIPVYVSVADGYSLAGLQFRAVLSAEGTAPLPGAITFTPAAGIPTPSYQLPGLAPNDIVCAWVLDAFSTSLQESNYLGDITFQVPAAAQSGQAYALHFLGVDGAPNAETLYQLESLPGSVWVNSAPLQPPQISSDEWRVYFFGSLTNSLAADDVDADGDGMLNWQEYLAGTNPTNAASCLRFTGAAFNTAGPEGMGVNWLTAPGKTYLLESQPALGGGGWTVINTNVGDGNYYQFIDTNFTGNARFYQIRLQP